MKASDLLLQSAEPFDKACILVREMEEEIKVLRKSLELIASTTQTEDLLWWQEEARKALNI